MRAEFPGIYLTRRSLIKMALAIFGGFLLLSLGIQWFHEPSPVPWLYSRDGPQEAEQALVEYLREHPRDRAVWIELARHRPLTRVDPDSPQWSQRFARFQGQASERSWGPYLGDAEFDRFLGECPVLPVEVLRAWRDSQSLERALGHLRGLDVSAEAQRAGGEICLQNGVPRRAIPWLQRARDLAPEEAELTAQWVLALSRAGETAALERAIEDPAVRSRIPAMFLFEYFSERGQWLRSFPYLMLGQLAHMTLGLLLTCLTVGACWTVLCLHLGRGWFWPRSVQCLVPVALLLGIAGALLCLVPIVVTDAWIGKGEKSGVLFSVVFSLLIGVREELCKLLLFLPLVPMLVRRASDVQIITVASLVGLGFAVEENTAYYLSSSGSAILGRFLTANFFHLTLTGYAGYHLVKAFQRGGEAWHQFLSELSKVIVFHAAYDFFLIEPAVAGYSIVSYMLFIVLSQQYLRLVFRLRPYGVHRVSLTRIFVACLATVAGLHCLYLTSWLGVGAALSSTVGGLVGIVIIGFMYFQEFDEHVA